MYGGLNGRVIQYLVTRSSLVKKFKDVQLFPEYSAAFYIRAYPYVLARIYAAWLVKYIAPVDGA